MNRKGAFYIILGFVFLSVFFLIFLTTNLRTYQARQGVVETRVISMNDFITNLHQDLDRAAYISGFRALIGIEEYLSAKGEFFSNRTELNVVFREAFTSGVVNGSVPDILANSTFENYLSRVELQAQRLGITANISVNNISLSQADPWTVRVEFFGNFIISDNRESAWWEYNKTFKTLIPIYNLKDPLYTVNTQGRVPNVIMNFTPPADGFVDPANDTTVLRIFVEESYYVENVDAPSYLQRFTNNLNADPNGIESIVYLPQLSDQGISVLTDRSVVDHIYFSNSPANSSDRCSIDKMIYSPDWFRIDVDHVDDYELEGLSYSTCA